MLNYLFLTLEFCGSCHGSCVGCFLTEEERNSDFAFLNAKNTKSSLDKLVERYKDVDIENLVLVFGRGNTFSLKENDLDELKKIIQMYSKAIKHKNLILEISTSLIGKIDGQIAKAKYILDNFGYDIRFNVVVNSDIVSNSFWQNLNIFYVEMGKYRDEKFGINANNNDVLTINVNPYKMPSVDFIEGKVKDYKFPINAVTVPLFNGTKEAPENILELVNNWNECFFNTGVKNGWDMNYRNLASDVMSILKNSESIEDVLNVLEHGYQNFYTIDKFGILRHGLFTIFGELDFERLMQKTNIKVGAPLEMYKEFVKVPGCLSCPEQKMCLASGGYILALLNHKIISKDNGGNLDRKFCHSGFKNIFKRVREENNE